MPIPESLENLDMCESRLGPDNFDRRKQAWAKGLKHTSDIVESVQGSDNDGSVHSYPFLLSREWPGSVYENSSSPRVRVTASLES